MIHSLHITNRVAYSVMLSVLGIVPLSSLILLFVGGWESLWLTIPILLASLIFYQDMITDHYLVIEIHNELLTVRKPLLKYHLWKKKRTAELVIAPDTWDELSVGYLKNTKFYCIKKNGELHYFFFAIGMDTFEKEIRTHFKDKKVTTYGTSIPYDELRKLKERSPGNLLK